MTLLSSIWSGSSLAALISVLSLLAAIYVGKKQLAKPRLAYEIRTTPLVTVHDQMGHGLKLMLDEKPVSRMHLIDARFENTGGAPINRSDFDTSLQIKLGTTSRGVTHEVLEPRPESLKDGLTVRFAGPTLIVIEPLLLNVGSSFRIKVLVEDFDGPAKLVEPNITNLQSNRIVNAGIPWTDSQAGRRLRLAGGVLATILVALALVVTVLGVVDLVNSVPEDVQTLKLAEEIRVRFTNRETLCGKLIRADDTHVIFKAEGGATRTYPRAKIVTMTEC